MGYYKQCYDCGKYINLAKPILGSLHFCLLPEEIIQKQNVHQLQNTQINFDYSTTSILKEYNQFLKAKVLPTNKENK